MRIYERGLQNHEDTTQEYDLSAILSGYYRGYRKEGFELQPIRCEDSDVKSDGSFDFSVPYRRPTKGISLRRLFRRIRLALKVLFGKASVLNYR